MQYILSEEEYRDLVQKKNLHINMQKQKLLDLCIYICNTMPVVKCNNTTIPWECELTKHSEYDCNKLVPWGCILTKNCQWYCDKCPVEEICPHEDKEYSK